MSKIIAYKAFNNDWKCRNFQFKVGESYEHKEPIKVCGAGFHSCTYPLDVLSYYELTESKFAIVELSGATETHKEDSKVCSSKIHIKAELQIPALIKASVDWHFDGWFKKAKKDDNNISKEANSNLAASGGGSNLAASGGGSNLAASGNYSNLAASGDDSKLAASGYGSKLAASGGGSNVIVSAERDIMVKGSINTFICLTHYVDGKPNGFTTGQIGKKGLCQDTWYKLDQNGKFIKAE